MDLLYILFLFVGLIVGIVYLAGTVSFSLLFGLLKGGAIFYMSMMVLAIIIMALKGEL